MKAGYVVTLLVALFARPALASDFSTPQGALEALEAAYVAKDIEAAVAAKNLVYEARAMLRDLKDVAEPDPEVVAEIAKALDLAFRKEMKDDGFPKFAGLRTRVLSTKELGPDLVEMTEEITFPDGYVSQELINAARSGERWGIVVLPGK